MAYTIQLGKTDKARNSTKVPSLGSSIQVLMKEDSSIIRPTWKLHMNSDGCPSMEQLAEYNYCYCPHLKRYYYITNIISFSASITYINCEVDVLATFKEDILATDAFIMFAESSYNSLIADSRLPITGESDCFVQQQELGLTDQAGCFVVTAATPNNDGKNGPAASVVMSEGALQALANKLYGEEWWDAIKNDFYHPSEALIGCMWTPLIAGNSTDGGYQEIKVGNYSLGGGHTAKHTVDKTLILRFQLPYHSTDPKATKGGDYRNLEPYSTYYAWLPGVGLVQVPMKTLFQGDYSGDTVSLPVRVSASPVTGDIEYQIMRPEHIGSAIGNGAVLLSVKGNFGVEVPIAQTKGSFGSVVQSLLTGVGGSAIATVGALTGNPIAFVGGLATALGSSANAIFANMNTNTMVSGGMGGWSIPPEYLMMMEAITVTHRVSDEPSNIVKTIGRPLFAKKKIGSLTGFVGCTGAYVKTWATEEEHQMIANYVNTSVNYLYGGLIVE